MSGPVLRVNGLTKAIGVPPRELFRVVHFEVAAGELVAITGESGSGKSTLLNVIAGLETADAGTVELEGVDLLRLGDDRRTRLRGAKIGFVFQAFHLLPHLTVAQNVELPVALNGLAGAAWLDGQAGAAGLAAVGLAGRGASYPRELSGGEMQRVAVARAIAHGPRLLLADEPTGNLDEENADAVLRLLAAQVRARGCAGVLVTHSARAAAVADRGYVLRRQRLEAGG